MKGRFALKCTRTRTRLGVEQANGRKQKARGLRYSLLNPVKKQLSTRRWILLRKKRDIQYLEFIILNLLAPDWLAGSRKHNAYYRNRFLEINILNQRNSEEIFTEMDSIVHSKLIIYYTTLTRNNRDNVYTNLIYILCKHLVLQARTLFP